MKYYSTNGNSPLASLEDAVVKGLAPDKGLYMPEQIKALDADFIANMDKYSFHEIACNVASSLFGEDISKEELNKIVCDTLSFPTPIVEVEPNIYSLELFHGPTAAFKDVGGRFMARMLSHFVGEHSDKITVLVATSGDTGSAVANGFLGVEGIDVVILYPKGKVSEIQEKQFTTLGQNITAIEVDGTFDDCQRLVKTAFANQELTSKMTLTSANSINVARFLPQMFYYFEAFAQIKRKLQGEDKKVVFCVPSGNFGNITSALFGQVMGLPVSRFIAANNMNDIFLEYIKTGIYSPRASVTTIANAMDVGDPSNFARILDLYKNSWEAIKANISASAYTDDQIKECINSVYKNTGYLLDPHGACGYLALKDSIKEGEVGIFLETAHPAKFLDTVEPIIGEKITIPETLEKFMSGKKLSIEMSKEFEDFKEYLLSI
ncbi:MAG: threonine synthase [Rikenellaceae bacterium]